MVADAPIARLLELDPDLGEGIEGERHGRALRRLVTRVHSVRAGAWDAEPLRPRDVRHHLGLLVVSGLLIQEVGEAERRGAEIAGPGDVLRPWVRSGPTGSVTVENAWTAIRPARVAVLDERLAALARPWPEVTTALMDRLVVRLRFTATMLSVMQHTRVDQRILLTLWHLADRWGRVCADGVSVPGPMSHRILGCLVGARRPSVTSALTRLRLTGAVLQRADGTWVLPGTPPVDAAELRDRVEVGLALGAQAAA